MLDLARVLQGKDGKVQARSHHGCLLTHSALMSKLRRSDTQRLEARRLYEEAACVTLALRNHPGAFEFLILLIPEVISRHPDNAEGHRRLAEMHLEAPSLRDSRAWGLHVVTWLLFSLSPWGPPLGLSSDLGLRLTMLQKLIDWLHRLRCCDDVVMLVMLLE